MFIAIRDLRFAKGRFALLTGVIALMTFMLVMLSGLTAGLGAASVSAVDALPVSHIAFQQPAAGQDVAFSTSTLPTSVASKLGGQPGVRGAYPIGISSGQLHAGSSTEAVTLFGTDAKLFPSRTAGHVLNSGEVAMTSSLTDSGTRVGDSVTIGGHTLRVGAVVQETSFNHLPVAYTDLSTWQQLTSNDGLTAVGLQLSGASTSELDSVANVHITSKHDAFGAVGAYSSEQGSLSLMRVLLVVVSVLIVGSFFTVWTMQRAGDLAVVRAVGGSRRYLLVDALGQAVIVLLAGTLVGTGFAALAGVAAAQVVPFLLTISTVALPLVAMVGMGLIGAALSVRTVTKVDPLSALGAVR